MISCGLSDCKDIWLCIVSMYILYLAKCPIFGGLPLLPFRKVTQQLRFSPFPCVRGTWASRYQRLEAVSSGRLCVKVRDDCLLEDLHWNLEWICWISDRVPPKCKKIPSVELSAYSVNWNFDCNRLKCRKFQVEDSSKTKIPGSFVNNTPGPAERRCLGEGIGY